MGKPFGRWLRVAFLSGLAALLARGQAQAAPMLFVDMTYNVDPALPGCPSEPEFISLVVGQLGYDPFRAGSPLAVVVRAWQGEQGIEGRLDWVADTQPSLGERRFTSPNQSCRQVLPAMGFALVVQIQLMATEATAETAPPAEQPDDASAGSSPREETPAPVEPPGPAPTLARAEPTSPAVSTPVKSSWSVRAGGGASVGLGLGPRVVTQGRLFAAVHDGRFLVELGAEASVPSSSRFDAGGFRYHLLQGTLAACRELGPLSACAIAKLGRLNVQGIDIDEPQSPRGFIAHVGPRLGWSVLLGDHVGLQARADGGYLLTPWTVELNHVPVWTMPSFSVSAGLDFFLRLE